MPGPLDTLRELGLNQLEAEIYLFLLPHPPCTAYRIAKSLGRPAANVYHAVESLVRRGAVMVDQGDSRTCRAVPAEQFLKRAERDFLEMSQAARTQLAAIEAAPLDERVYRIETAGQVFEHCREMLDRARVVAVVDAFPAPLTLIRPWIETALKRGIEVHLEAYEPIDFPGALVAHASVVTPSSGPANALHQWRAQQLNLVVDGKENLMALLSLDGQTVLQAYWSNSLYLSCLHHGGRLCEQTLIHALEAARRGATADQLRTILEEHPFFLRSKVPGQRELVRRYAAPKSRKAIG